MWKNTVNVKFQRILYHGFKLIWVIWAMLILQGPILLTQISFNLSMDK